MKLLSQLHPSPAQKKLRKRVGRGIGSTLGKTCGRGHKGYGSRSGSKRKIGFEGGQMPLQRRLPKFGFTSNVSTVTARVRLSDILRKRDAISNQPLTIDLLCSLKIITSGIKRVKVYRDPFAQKGSTQLIVAEGQAIVLSASINASL